jgi:hypothetical protein
MVSTVIIKGIRQEVKISLNETQDYIYLPRTTTAGNGNKIIYYKILDFDLIDYIWWFGTMNTEYASGSDVLFNVDESTEDSYNITDGTKFINSIDLTGIEGRKQVEIIINSKNTGDDCYLTDWGYYVVGYAYVAGP